MILWDKSVLACVCVRKTHMNFRLLPSNMPSPESARSNPYAPNWVYDASRRLCAAIKKRHTVSRPNGHHATQEHLLVDGNLQDSLNLLDARMIFQDMNEPLGCRALPRGSRLPPAAQRSTKFSSSSTKCSSSASTHRTARAICSTKSSLVRYWLLGVLPPPPFGLPHPPLPHQSERNETWLQKESGVTLQWKLANTWSKHLLTPATMWARTQMRAVRSRRNLFEASCVVCLSLFYIGSWWVLVPLSLVFLFTLFFSPSYPHPLSLCLFVVNKGSGSRVHGCPRPCLSTFRWAKFSTHRHRGPHSGCNPCSRAQWHMHHRMCVIAKETGLSPLACTCSKTSTFLRRLHISAHRFLCLVAFTSGNHDTIFWRQLTPETVLSSVSVAKRVLRSAGPHLHWSVLRGSFTADDLAESTLAPEN